MDSVLFKQALNMNILNPAQTLLSHFETFLAKFLVHLPGTIIVTLSKLDKILIYFLFQRGEPCPSKPFLLCTVGW